MLPIRDARERSHRRRSYKHAFPNGGADFERPGMDGRPARPVPQADARAFDGFQKRPDPCAIGEGDGIRGLIGGLTVAPFEEPAGGMVDAVDGYRFARAEDLDRVLRLFAVAVADAVRPVPDRRGRPVEDGEFG